MEDIINRYKGNKEAGQVPEGYFDALPDQVLARIAEEDAQMQALLEAHRNNEGYPVPEGYFDQLPGAVIAKATAQPSRRLFLQRRWVRVASVAACAGLLIGTGIYIFSMFQNIEYKEGGQVAQKVTRPSAPSEQPQQTLDFDKTLAQVANTPEIPVERKKTVSSGASASPATDVATDQFISENLVDDDLDEVDFDILDFYSDDMAASDLWGF